MAGRRLKVPAPAILGPVACFMVLALWIPERSFLFIHIRVLQIIHCSRMRAQLSKMFLVHIEIYLKGYGKHCAV